MIFEAHRLRRFRVAAAALVSVASHAAFGATATTVSVDLADRGVQTPMATGLMYGTKGVDLKKATDTVKPSRTTAPAGAITF